MYPFAYVDILSKKMCNKMINSNNKKDLTKYAILLSLIILHILSGHTHSYDDSLSMTHSTNFTISTGCSGSFDLLVGISFRFYSYCMYFIYSSFLFL